MATVTQIEIDTILRQLELSPGMIVPLIHSVPHEKLKQRPKPGKWSAHEHACHLAEVHPLMEKRLDQMLNENHPKINSYQPDRDDEQDLLLKKDLELSIEKFRTDRQNLVEQLKSLSFNQWKRTADHDEYHTYSVFIMFRHLAMHDLFHAYRIEEILLEK